MLPEQGMGLGNFWVVSAGKDGNAGIWELGNLGMLKNRDIGIWEH